MIKFNFYLHSLNRVTKLTSSCDPFVGSEYKLLRNSWDDALWADFVSELFDRMKDESWFNLSARAKGKNLKEVKGVVRQSSSVVSVA